MNDYAIDEVFDNEHLNRIYFILGEAKQTLSLTAINECLDEAIRELNQLRS